MSDTPWAIRAEGLSKKFGLTLRQSMKYGLRDATRRMLGKPSENTLLRDGEFWAVRNVSFELREGEALGIMGVNGSGKTTLLRILNGVYAPDVGRAQLRGRVGAMIAAGAGFSPMLSGRENVYVNGALLGLSTREIDGLMDEIVAFSELERFIDLPVKNYSSGMYVRLGFAIAALSRPDILVMDEVLAVGDLNFQKKCYDHILELKRKGTAIILVSHAPGAIWAVCDRGLFINQGELKVDGSTEDVIRAYEDQNALNAVRSDEKFAHAVDEHVPVTGEALPAEYGHSRGGTGDALILSTRILSETTGAPIADLQFGESFVLEVRYRVLKTLLRPLFRSSIDAAHYRFIVSIDSHEQGFLCESLDPGEYVLRVIVREPSLRPGAYRINTSIVPRDGGMHICYWLGATSFVVIHPQDRFFYSNDKAVVFFRSDFDLQRC
jgi:lipopolysaccharide transport system ATP-binding protein